MKLIIILASMSRAGIDFFQSLLDRHTQISQLPGKFFIDDYKYMEANKNRNYDEYKNEHPIVRTHPETGKKILFVNWTYTKKITGLNENESDEILNKIFKHQARLELTCRFTWTEILYVYGTIEV